ncbi:hypothetical protein CPB86DRAFT_545940 [Serendipita vermifera]|nr:hypothetical protein CPB86DRAFT_545940 [Serendipita vermifera]
MTKETETKSNMSRSFSQIRFKNDSTVAYRHFPPVVILRPFFILDPSLSLCKFSEDMRSIWMSANSVNDTFSSTRSQLEISQVD